MLGAADGDFIVTLALILGDACRDFIVTFTPVLCDAARDFIVTLTQVLFWLVEVTDPPLCMPTSVSKKLVLRSCLLHACILLTVLIGSHLAGRPLSSERGLRHAGT